MLSTLHSQLSTNPILLIVVRVAVQSDDFVKLLVVNQLVLNGVPITSFFKLGVGF